ncbi:hypothetical protein K4F52_002743 [Lecanicillium sp. MT-2017a]|nr:hypothetical protein K4F52_002743 [Lecanicillium sp. MT-2017a]
MRAAISTIVVLGGALGATAIGSLSEFIVDIPSCSYSSFSKAVEKEGCDVKNVSADTLKCLCKHLTSIVVSMTTDDLDLNCQANFQSAIAGACTQWEVQGTAAPDLAVATKALASELAGKTPGPAASGSEPTGGEDASQTEGTAAETSSSEGPAAAATPFIGLLGGAAAIAGLMI